MARSKKQDANDARKRDLVLERAKLAAAGEVPDGYSSYLDWHETTVRFYSDLFKDDEFKAEFEAIIATRVEPILSLDSGKRTPQGRAPRRTTRVAAPEPEMSDEEKKARAYLAEYRGTFEFLNDLKLKFLVEHPEWTMSPKQIAAVLRCKTMDQQRKPKSPVVTEDGMYRVPDGSVFGAVYKVQKAVHGSGRLYAKKLHGTRFEYDPGAVFKIKPEHKMTLDEAKTFGKLYGVCCVCARTLTDEGSIAEGIGPICAGKEWF